MEKYWRSLEEFKNGKDLSDEKIGEYRHKNAVLDVLDSKVTESAASRRDFLKLFGFSFATAAIVSSCEKPVQKAIPYLIRPEEVTPGKASYYASTFFDGTEYASVLVKVRDGRPVKIEGNADSPVSRGGTSARIQASVLNLYDEARYKNPQVEGIDKGWDEVDKMILENLGKKGRSVLLTSTIISPSTRYLISEFLTAHPGMEWIEYDEISAEGIRRAHQILFGKRLIPGYHFERADYILSFDADFLGTWLSPVEFARDYAVTRRITREHSRMSKHVQVESSLSLTGTNADERIPVTPSESVRMITAIYNCFAGKKGYPVVSASPPEHNVDHICETLESHKGKSVIISGSNDPSIQAMIAGLNYMLENYGITLDTERHIRLKNGDDPRFEKLQEALSDGKIDNLIIYNANPVYSSAGNFDVSAAGKSVYIGSAYNETAKGADIICPDHHFLESWGDAEPVSGSFSLQQPCISPIFNTRSFQDTLLKWTGKENITYYDFLREYWKENLYNAGLDGFESWWNTTLQAGYYEAESSGNPALKAELSDLSIDEPEEGLSLILYTPVGLMDGRHANNPWLQELPDPVSKICWDNYLAVSPADAVELGLETEMIVTVHGQDVVVLVQPGQAKGTVSLALAYGRTFAGRVADNIGVNAYRFAMPVNGIRQYNFGKVSIEKTSGIYPLAMTQTHHSMEGRPIVRETTLEEYRKDPYAGNHFHLEAEEHHQTLYPEVKFDGYHWGLVIDQNTCIGCNNCIVACTSENNVATVGKEEVRNRRIMHWLRIDRYYSESPDNPKVVHQPVMCQHCDNAPCENVCPVSATMHSNEGLNQVAYVRCIGTKYCINNCPYRVRRFNWFKYVNNDKFNYHLNSDFSKLVLNPDVTVRSRGVVEKCTFCVQRIQEKKLLAKLENRSLKDGEIKPSCVQSCPTGALVFGNTKDPESRVSRLMKEERNYYVLEQLHTLPSVGYLTKVRNIDPEGEADQPAHSDQHG